MWTTWCKICGKVDISVDKIFLFKLVFLGFFSACLPNIYFNTSEYLNTLDLLYLIKGIDKHFAIQRYTAFLTPALLLWWMNEETCLYEHFRCWTPENDSHRGLAYWYLHPGIYSSMEYSTTWRHKLCRAFTLDALASRPVACVTMLWNIIHWICTGKPLFVPLIMIKSHLIW